MSDLSDPFSDVFVQQALTDLQEAMKRMTDEQRMEVLNRLFEGYCKHCGSKDTFYEGRRIYCQCTND